MAFKNKIIAVALLATIAGIAPIAAMSRLNKLVNIAGNIAPVRAFNKLTPKQKFAVGVTAAGVTGVLGTKLYRHFHPSAAKQKSLIPTWLYNTPLKKGACYLGATVCLAAAIPSNLANAHNTFIPTSSHPVEKAIYTLYNHVSNPPSVHEYLTHVVVIGGILATREAMMSCWSKYVR